MPPKKMLSVLFMRNGMPWALGALVGVAVCVVLGLAVNFKFLILALIWIFLFVPLVVAFLYFFYGMKPLTAFNSIPHTVVCDENGIKVRIKELKENPGEEEGEEIRKEYPVGKDEKWEITAGANYALLINRRKGWLWIPVGAFSGIDDFNNFLKQVNGSIDKK